MISQGQGAMELNDFFRQIYLNPATHSNSVEGLFQNARKNNFNYLIFSRNDVQKFLENQKSFRTFQPIDKSQFQSKIAAVEGRFRKWQMDLIDMKKYSDEIDGTKYILTIIDVFSKYAFAIPLASKKATGIASALTKIFSVQNTPLPRILQSDNGKEFVADVVKNVCKKYGIFQFFSYPYSPLGFIERFNQTLKKKIFTWLHTNRHHQMQPNRYIDALPALLQNYNHSIHSTLRETPAMIQFCNINTSRCLNANRKIYNRLLRANDKTVEIRNPHRMGDSVVILSHLNPFISNLDRNKIKLNFNKVTTQKWTDDEFQIGNIQNDSTNPNILRHTLIDKYNHVVMRKFYHHELQKVGENT
jgi:transposase InsO family protein